MQTLAYTQIYTNTGISIHTIHINIHANTDMYIQISIHTHTHKHICKYTQTLTNTYP